MRYRQITCVAIVLLGITFTPLSWAEFSYANEVSKGFRQKASIEVVEKSKTASPLKKNESLISAKGIKELDGAFKDAGSRAMLISVGGRLAYEKYSSPFFSKWWRPLGFSMSKSVTAILIGRAHCDGYITSLGDQVQKYVPTLKDTSWGIASVRDLLMMASGAYATSLTYNGHKTRQMEMNIGEPILTGRMNRDFIEYMKSEDDKKFPPGKYWNYSNFDTIALGILLTESTGKPVAKYMEETLWAEIKSEYDGAWVVNNLKQTSTYQGFSAHPHDWIRLGQWMLSNLKSGDSCMSDYLKQMVTNQIGSEGNSDKYGFQTWIEGSYGVDFFFAGFGGQYLAFNLKSDSVMYHHAATDNSLVRITYPRFGYVVEKLLN